MTELQIEQNEFAAVWNDTVNYPTVADVATKMDLKYPTCKVIAYRMKQQRIKGDGDCPELIDRARMSFSSPIPEMQYRFMESWSEEDCINSLRTLALSLPGKSITRIFYRSQTEVSDSTWNRYFGTFLEFKRQAALELSRPQHEIERKIAKHVSADHYREFNKRRDYSNKYDRSSNKKMRVIMGASDLHDQEIDPFYLRCLIAAAKMIQPDVINLGGDIFDLPEFGKYGVDPREWDVVGRIKFVHEHILAPLREAAPDAQIDFVEGNHEFRLLRHLADATPALKTVLSDLHGMTIASLLGLDRFEINYIARADLAAFTEADRRKQIGKSYVTYNDALLIHHHPHAAQWGLPGWNGHHHKWLVSHHKNVIKGAYSWMQLGCGHQLRASYTEGEFWTLGFNICHLNTQTKSATFEYVNVTDSAAIGGCYLFREPEEMVGHFAGSINQPE